MALTIFQFTTDDNKKVLATHAFTFSTGPYEGLVQNLISNSLAPESLKDLEKTYAAILNVSSAGLKDLDTKLTASLRHFTNNILWYVSTDKTDIYPENNLEGKILSILCIFCGLYCPCTRKGQFLTFISLFAVEAQQQSSFKMSNFHCSKI